MFRGELARGPYTRAALIGIGAFVAATAAFPFLLMSIVEASGCRSIGGACGAVGLVASIYIKPIIYFSFVLSFITITVKRLRDLRLPVSLVVVLPLLMIADASFGIAFGAPWSVGFVLGAFSFQWPRYLFAALACIVFLCVVPRTEGDTRRWGMAAAIALGVVVTFSLGATLAIIRTAAMWIDPLNGMKFAQTATQYYGLYGTPILLVLVLSLAAWRQARESRPNGATKP